ncbi:bifunctional hydroxymethylpyrimidine kinase/phosphomethylpyrimidine kinase [Coprobacter tertius]|uniref:hydroxymethylpyrimidine kinase n=1 Tax=Coprobacter tertius TaxID=2944915 RepID=A0ABT1MHA5_9BACT|nr:bifunctional hydroxymethylpyrimidine kinase/phosphomethylpyrimidine kinase [Coprobacter tertius]MCP9612015.1 bifunctional hydroxymethylpyrimidine kinase/phosphomethylpyrimidine kinase [Coprobacter tertius]
MNRYPKCLTIAGSDCSGGAGIQADLKTMSAIGVYGMSAITAVTAQNTCGVTAIQPIEREIVKAQLEAVFSDIGADAVKIGMLHSPGIVETVIEMLDKYTPPYIILDPVMISTSGHKLIEDETIGIIKSKLFCRSTLITPNIDEAILLSGKNITTENEMYAAADILIKNGCNAVLMKGGHLKNAQMTDILFTRQNDPLILRSDPIDTVNSHGTGCTLSSAIASYLALGYTLNESTKLAKKFITTALKKGANIKTGTGHGPLNHFFAPHPLKVINS